MINKTFFKLITCFLIVSGTSFASEKSPIVVVDVERIVLESLSGKDLTKKFEDKMDKFQKKFSSKEADFQKEKESLEKKQAILSKEAFEKEAKAFQAKAMELQKLAQSERISIENAKMLAMDQIDVAAKEITRDLAKEREFLVVSPIAAILFYDDKIDITEEILTRLNKKITKVTFEVKSK